MSREKNSAWESSLEDVAEGSLGEPTANAAPTDGGSDSARKKACCVCGKDVSHEQRFKDKSGHYWCTECNRLDEARKHPAKCPDCDKELTEADLVDFQGVKVCPECSEKRTLSAKRAAARIAAAEAEERKQAERRHLILLIVGGLVGAAVLFGIIYGTYRFLFLRA